MNNEITVEQFSKVLPKNIKGNVSQEMVDQINSFMVDPMLREVYRENLLGFASVIQEGKFKLPNYIDAVRFVSFKMLGSTNIEAYVKTFPDRYQNFIDKGVSDKDIASYIASYNKNKLVTLVYGQTMMPTHIINADLYQKAINTQAELMISARSEKVRSDAAESLLKHLRPPEVKKVELDISTKEDKSISELREVTMALVEQQRQAIKGGIADANTIARSQVIKGEAEVVEVS